MNVQHSSQAFHGYPHGLQEQRPHDPLASYQPRICPDGNEGVTGIKIHGIIVPTGLGNATHVGELDVRFGGMRVWTALQKVFEREEAIVSHEVIPVDQIIEEVRKQAEQKCLVRNAPEIVAVTKETAACMKAALAEGYFPILAGGDHSSILKIIAMLEQYRDPNNPEFSNLKLVFVDAHPDALKDTKPGRMGNAYGRTIRVLLGDGHPDLMPLMEGVPKLRPENLLYIALCEPDPQEMAFIKEKDIQYIDLDEFRDDPREAKQKIRDFLTIEIDGKQYRAPFHLDVDADATDCPGTPIQNEEGLDFKELCSLARVCNEAGQLVSAGFGELLSKLDQGTIQTFVGFLTRLMGMGNTKYYGGGYDIHAPPPITQN